MRKPLAVLIPVVLLSVAAAAYGEGDPYQGVAPNDPLALARLADELGESGLDAQLKLGLPRGRTLLALEAAPYAQRPERLLPGLAALAAGRDPQLAPSAAAALWFAVERMDPTEIASRELDPADLVAARAAIARGREEPVPRADVLFAFDQADSGLAALQQVLGLKTP